MVHYHHVRSFWNKRTVTLFLMHGSTRLNKSFSNSCTTNMRKTLLTIMSVRLSLLTEIYHFITKRHITTLMIIAVAVSCRKELMLVPVIAGSG